MLQRKYFWLFSLLSLILSIAANDATAQKWNPNHSVSPISGKVTYQNGQTPDQLIEIYAATISPASLIYEWQVNYTANEDNFVPVSAGGSQSSYTAGPIFQTTYYRRKTTHSSGAYIYSNVIKLTVVSASWEDRNFIREHTIKVTGITTAQAVEQLPIGQKFQSTTYFDGLGRNVQEVDREIATPSQAGGVWGDRVQYFKYDEWGRVSKEYLPYTTTTEPGKVKTNADNEQQQYYSSVYNEINAYSNITYEENPLSRVRNIKKPGSAWVGSAGNETTYDINQAADEVRIFSIDYVQGNPPVIKGTYAAATLFKNTYTDVNGKWVVEYVDKLGRLILKKVQIADAPSAGHDGWSCTYYVCDIFGQLRFELEPEAVKYLSANSWSLAAAEWQQVLNGWCYQYYYDEKGRVIWKKGPDAKPVNMLYDARDRLVFMQDGNQAAFTSPQWSVNLYDAFDRPVITALYNTNKTIASLQCDINNAITITNAPGPANQVTGISLVIDQRQAGIARYAATKSIAFVNGFETVLGDEFVAEIDPNVTGINSVTTTAFTSPINTDDLNNAGITTILKYLFYDDYTFASAKSFNTSFTNLAAYSNADPNVKPIVSTKRTLSQPTGSLIRVLGGTSFLATTLYYDEDGKVIQILKDNVKAGLDITTWQYHFDGRMLSSCFDHTTSGTGYSNFITLSKNNYDKLGRITSIEKQFGANAFKTISTIEYDDFGRVKKKRLDPGYTAGGNNELESLDYSYNLHGTLTGINKDYALKNPANYNKWGHFFGQYLGFDNRDGVFTNRRLNGQLAGVLWNTQGDDAQRKYDYLYDNANQLTNANFTEQKHPGEGFSNSKMDFSVGGTSGKITYDLNGNLLSMLQKGIIPGSAAPVVIDDLAYAYENFSNKLKTVTDNTPLNNSGLNGKFGDFKDGGSSTTDYVYDDNGNLVIDLNKDVKDLEQVLGANGISCNFLNKPENIRIAGKGTIRIVYSAVGEKLQRAFIPETGGQATVTTYVENYVYQQAGSVTTTVAPPFLVTGGSLSYINFEEGRIRVVEAITTQDPNGYDALQIAGNINLPNGKMGAYDYFISDYLHNVRMVLTEETHIAINTCTMETGRATTEVPVFGQTGTANEVETTRYAAGPTNWQNSDIGASVSRLGNIAGHNIGPNTLQKVMAGDQVSTSVQYYYQAATGGDNPNLVSTLLTSLAQAIVGGGIASDLAKVSVTPIRSQLNGTNGFLQTVRPASDGTIRPKAYLTALFFDERFNFVEAVDGGVMQQQVASSVSTNGSSLGFPIKAPKNGYVYIYVSNESDQDVYFDNLKVGITRGNIIEENHYYAYGLKIAAISSRKPGHVNEGVLKNDHQFQGAFSEMDDDIGWNDFALRSYDPQIGRWAQQDPYEEFASPFLGMGNDPVNNIDPNGGSILTGLTLGGRLAVTTITGAFVGTIAGLASGDDTPEESWRSAGIGAGLGFLSGLGGMVATVAIQGANQLALVLNSSTKTASVGAGNNGSRGKTTNSIQVGTTFGDSGDPDINNGDQPDHGTQPPTLEDVVNKIMEMKVGDKKNGKDLEAMHPFLKKNGISRAINSIERTQNGIKLDVKLIAMAWVSDGTEIKIERVRYPSSEKGPKVNYEVYHISTSGIKLDYKVNNVAHRAPLNIYLHGDRYTNIMTPGHPALTWKIFPGAAPWVP